jgi:acyl carrier protein
MESNSMKTSRSEVRAHLVRLLHTLSEDWDGVGDIDDGTYLIADLNWRSMDVIYLANSLQDHYGQTFPFTDLFTEIGQREHPDISVGEWVDFLHEHLGPTPAVTRREEPVV